MASLPHLLRAPGTRRQSSTALRHTVSGLALLAGSVSLAALASPVQAQCVEAPANNYTCSGSIDTTQTLNGPTVTIATTPGSTVDTLSNGGGSTFVVNGVGTVAYLDGNASRLAGGGAYFTSDAGDLVIVSNGAIDSDLGLQGLGLETLNGGDINVTWTGHIDNSSGDGVRAIGAGQINLLLSSVTAQDIGIDAHQDGPGGMLQHHPRQAAQREHHHVHHRITLHPTQATTPVAGVPASRPRRQTMSARSVPASPHQAHMSFKICATNYASLFHLARAKAPIRPGELLQLQGSNPPHITSRMGSPASRPSAFLILQKAPTRRVPNVLLQ